MAFAESPTNRKRRPLAADIDARFALDAESFLLTKKKRRRFLDRFRQPDCPAGAPG